MRLVDRYRTVADLPTEIPVFPLKGVILLPRAELPLQIFEPRYLVMLDAVMSGSRVLGIIQPEGDGGITGSPDDKGARLRRVGCAGRVTAFQELDDGRLMIQLTGLARFEIVSEIDSPSPYRVCHASYNRFGHDLEAGRGEMDVDRERLLTVLKSFLEARKLQADWKAISATGTEQLVNALSAMSPFGPEEKQALLEAEGLKSRADVLVTLAEMEIASSTSSGSSGSRLQ